MTLRRKAWILAITAWPLCASTASTLVDQIHLSSLDASECFHVRDLSYTKEDLKYFFNDGYLIFSKPINGAPFAAVFSGEIEGGDAEVLVTPPHRSERRAMAAFADSPTLNTHFLTGLFLFTDSTARDLYRLAADQGRPSQEAGLRLAEKYSTTVRNIADSFQLRLLMDWLNGDPSRGIFYSTIISATHGDLDLIYDPIAYDQITIGQFSANESSAVFDIWSTFQAASVRHKASSELPVPFELNGFHIDATIEPDLNMTALTQARMKLIGSSGRVLPFEISAEVAIDEVRIDGVPAEVFRRERTREAALLTSGSSIFLVVPNQTLDPAVTHQIEFKHHGHVIRQAGPRVFYVSSRTNWYPSLGHSLATFDLTFHYPKELDLETNGELVSNSVEGEQKTTHHRTGVPVRFAGFNLGEYQCVPGNRGGYRFDVCGSRSLDPALRGLRPRVVLTEPLNARSRLSQESTFHTLAVPPPDPIGKLKRLSVMIADVFEFYAARFGPPPLKTLTVTPIPAGFGQGFPGLIYLATAAYLDPVDLPQRIRDAGLASFYEDLLAAHEVAHQWWGNKITSTSYQDNWLQESLANYSALLYIERRKGPKPVAVILDEYRRHLLSKAPDGRSVESAGPITFGMRLSSSHTPDAWQVITYEKGTWILHMLRTEMGDAQFQKLLSELARQYAHKPLSTDDFRSLAVSLMPPGSRDPKLEAFFENWVYATGIPSIKFSHSVSDLVLEGKLSQSGVARDFEVDVPVEVTFAKAPASIYWIRTSSSDPVEFSIRLKQQPLKVQIGSAFLQAK